MTIKCYFGYFTEHKGINSIKKCWSPISHHEVPDFIAG